VVLNNTQYVDRCKEIGVMPRYGRSRIQHKMALKKATARADSFGLEEMNISGMSREEAESVLLARSKDQAVGISGLELFFLQAIFGWIIRKILNRMFQ